MEIYVNWILAGIVVIAMWAFVYSWRIITKQQKAYIDYINSSQPHGRLVVRGNRVMFVPNTPPVDPKV